MKFHSAHKGEDAFDGLTAEDIRRIRGGAAASVTPGLEGLAEAVDSSESPKATGWSAGQEHVMEKRNKRGRRQ